MELLDGGGYSKGLRSRKMIWVMHAASQGESLEYIARNISIGFLRDTEANDG